MDGDALPAEKDESGWSCADGADIVCLNASVADGSFDAVDGYAGDLPALSMQGRANLKESAAGTMLQVRVGGRGQDARGLLVGEALTAQVHAGPCGGIDSPTGPLVEVSCDDRWRCTGTAATEWTPPIDSQLSGLSFVVFDSSSDEPLGEPILCADLADRVPNVCPRKSRPVCAADGAELVVAEGGGLACSDGSAVDCRRRKRSNGRSTTTESATVAGGL